MLWKKNGASWRLVHGMIIIIVMPLCIFSSPDTGYVNKYGAPTGHVVGKYNVALVGFMKIMTNFFLCG